MRGKADLRPGATYLMSDFTLIQVLALEGDAVRYRAQGWSWGWDRRVVVRRSRAARLKAKVRAEVNGAFYPDLALPGLCRFEHAETERAALDAYLAERARSRPFAKDH